jgi:iron complex outermembrane receptor protein
MHRGMLSLLASCALIAIAGPAPAQSSQTAPQPGERDAGAKPAESSAGAEVERVVVTARRTEESLQAVPIAVTVVKGEQLERAQIRSLADLQNLVPSASVSGYQNKNLEWFSLRGQGETGFAVGGGIGGGPAVVGYFSEVAAPIAGPGLYYDLSSVQVLKGPQGTLFGRNTTGGAILFEPTRPSYRLTGYGQALAGSDGRTEVQAALNTPLVADTLAVRIAAQAGGRDGYTKDAFTGADYDNRRFKAARLGVLYQPSATIENYFLLNYVDYKEHGPGNQVIAVNPSIRPDLLPYLDQQRARGVRQTALSMQELNQGRFQNLINKTSWRITQGLTLRNIVSSSHRQIRRQDDEDGTPAIVLDSLGSDPGQWNFDIKTLTEELRLEGRSFDRRLNWQTGAYYEDSHDGGPQSFTQQYAANSFVRSFNTKFGSRSKALYAEAGLKLDEVAEGLTATAGYRVTHDSLYSGLGLSGGATPTSSCLIGPSMADCFHDDHSSSTGTSYKLGLDYQLGTSTLLYATARQGYKQGGFNIIASLLGDKTLFAYRPEYVRDVEVGLKTDWKLAGIAGRTNVALFQSKYRDAQVLSVALVAGGPQGITVNAARATIRGLEIENVLRPTRNLELSLMASRLDASYDRYVTPLGDDVSDTPYPNAPRNKLGLGLRYRLPLQGALGEVWLGGNYAYQSQRYVGITAFGRGVTPVAFQPGYGVLGLRAEWNKIGGSAWSFAAWVSNATDKVYTTTVEDLYNAVGASVATYGEPRMFGASLRYDF